MPTTKGNRLYVNLSASQTRRRLQSFGHGVKKIQSAGKNQAVVIHAATGQHLDELKLQFSDVAVSTNEEELSEPVQNLRHVGPSTAALLRDVGIKTIAELLQIGPLQAYQLVKRLHPKVSLRLLEALTAGLSELPWQDISAATRIGALEGRALKDTVPE